MYICKSQKGDKIMKKVSDILSKFFFRTFTAFTLITVSVCLFGLIFEVKQLISYMIFAFLGFSALLAVSFLIGDLIKNNSVLRNTVKFVLSYLSLVIMFFVSGPLSLHTYLNGSNNKGFTILAVSLAFVLVYFVIGLVILLVSFIKNKIANSDKDYESMFDNK